MEKLQLLFNLKSFYTNEQLKTVKIVDHLKETVKEYEIFKDFDLIVETLISAYRAVNDREAEIHANYAIKLIKESGVEID